MLEDPGLDTATLATALQEAWAVDASAFSFVRGYDMRAASYEVVSAGAPVFLKVRFGPAPDVPLEVPRALLEAGVANILAPTPTRTGDLWRALGDGTTLALYPFVAGRNAMVAGMTAAQWRVFGSTLRAVHDSGLPERFADRLPTESFGLASAALVRRALELANEPPMAAPTRRQLQALLRDRSKQIDAMLDRAGALGQRLREHRFEHVLCHADIHAANILVADDGRIFLVDWDGPMLAPRERDLLFVIGSRIARAVEPREDAWFFEGYGEVAVDPEAIVYYRYERILEDIGEIARSVFEDDALSEASSAEEVALAASFFEPGGIVETVELVQAPRLEQR